MICVAITVETTVVVTAGAVVTTVWVVVVVAGTELAFGSTPAPPLALLLEDATLVLLTAEVLEGALALVIVLLAETVPLVVFMNAEKDVIELAVLEARKAELVEFDAELVEFVVELLCAFMGALTSMAARLIVGTLLEPFAKP